MKSRNLTWNELNGCVIALFMMSCTRLSGRCPRPTTNLL